MFDKLFKKKNGTKLPTPPASPLIITIATCPPPYSINPGPAPGAPPPSSVGPAELIETIAVFPDTPTLLQINIYTHDYSTGSNNVFPAWTYASSGLSSVGQQEILFTVKRAPNETPNSYPTDPINFFPIVYELAKQGRIVGEYEFTKLGEARLFLGRFLMLAYIPAQPIPAITSIPRNALHVVLLTPSEAAVAESHGTMRALGNLTFHYRFFPFVFWIDRSRQETSSKADLAGSLVEKTLFAHAAGVSVSKAATHLTMTVRPRGHNRLRSIMSQVPVSTPITLALDLDTDVDAYFVWRTTFTQPIAVSHPSVTTTPRKMGCCTFNFCPAQPTSSLLQREDGYFFLVSSAHYQQFRNAISSGTSITIPIPGGVDFRLTWLSDTYVNPMDGTVLKSTGGWQTHQPERPAGAAPAAKTGHVDLGQMVLLSAPTHEDCDLQLLVDYIKRLDVAMKRVVPQNTGRAGKQVVVQISLEGGKVLALETMFKPDSDGLDGQALREALRDVSPPMHCKVTFQQFYDVWGGVGAGV
ncbi:hypothetical protein HDV00_004680 [Rhizophlyctis rosea]|nr:hypothetical protein HDV00_004680 [Rhizophlyctis rosea]